MSNVEKIATGTTVPSWKLKDATFSKVRRGKRTFFVVKTTDDETYLLDALQALKLSGRGGPGPRRFEKWLEEVGREPLED